MSRPQLTCVADVGTFLAMRRTSSKSQSLKIRLSPEEKQSFEDAAELAGLSLSAWIRGRLRKAATTELEAASRQIAFVQAQRAAG